MRYTLIDGLTKDADIQSELYVGSQRRLLIESSYGLFLVFARYVSSVAKRSIWDQGNIDDRPTDQRPTSLPERAFLEELQTAISQ